MFSGVASAQQIPKQDTKCINSINKGASKVAKAQAGDNNACVKNYGKEKIPSADACVTSDPKGKVAKAISKIKTSDCPSGAPSALPNLQTNSGDIGVLMVNKDLDLVHDLFGSDLDNAIVLASVDKPGSKCQGAVLKAAGKCQDAMLSSYNSCGKDGMKSGTISGAVGLQAGCLGVGSGSIPDGKGKIAKKCGGDFDLAKKCSGQDLEALFPGFNPHVSAGAIDTAIECRVCLALNALDGLSRDCDLFDDGVANGSCAGGGHKCVLDEASTLTITTELLPIPALPLTGSLDITCDIENVDGGTGKAPCTCTIQDLDPIPITGIGTACVTAGIPGSCPVGEVDCNGGNVLDWDTIADHDLGACTGNADCSTQCDAHCAGLGPYTQSLSPQGCEGFCAGGDNEDTPCTLDEDCPGAGGSCTGGEPVGHAGICQCTCLAMVGNASRAGGIKCLIPANIFITTPAGSPCTDPPSIDLGTVCIPATTETNSVQILNANVDPGDLPGAGPDTDIGIPGDCEDLDASVLAGTKFIGQIAFYDSALGDLITKTVFGCQ